MAKIIADGAGQVKGVEVELPKIGAPFSLFKLEDADGIIFGSPNNYGTVTSKMKTFLDSLKHMGLLSGKIGGIFESYTWNRGDVIAKLTTYLTAYKMRGRATPLSISSPVSIGYRDYDEIDIDEEYVKRCEDLGRIVAELAVATSPKTS